MRSFLKKVLPSCLSSSACRFDPDALSAAGDISGGPRFVPARKERGWWMGGRMGGRFGSGKIVACASRLLPLSNLYRSPERETRKTWGAFFRFCTEAPLFDYPRAKIQTLWLAFAGTLIENWTKYLQLGKKLILIITTAFLGNLINYYLNYDQSYLLATTPKFTVHKVDIIDVKRDELFFSFEQQQELCLFINKKRIDQIIRKTG